MKLNFLVDFLELRFDNLLEVGALYLCYVYIFGIVDLSSALVDDPGVI